MRIIATVPILNGVHVQSYNFKKYLPIGSPKISLEFLTKWQADEILLLNIKGSLIDDKFFYKSIKDYSKNCFVPLTVGGGIKSIKDVERFIKSGADKVSINTFSFLNKNLIIDSSKEFGRQAIVGCLDIKKVNKNFYAFTHSGTKNTNICLLDACKKLEDNGVGEIIINSIDNDGTRKGFNTKIIELIQSEIKVPLIISGGANNINHFLLLKRYNLSGIAAANFFTFTEQSVLNLKKKLSSSFKDIRV